MRRELQIASAALAAISAIERYQTIIIILTKYAKTNKAGYRDVFAKLLYPRFDQRINGKRRIFNKRLGKELCGVCGSGRRHLHGDIAGKSHKLWIFCYKVGLAVESPHGAESARCVHVCVYHPPLPPALRFFWGNP